MDGTTVSVQLRRRLVLYGAGALLAGLLLYLGFWYLPPPGFDTRMEKIFTLVNEGRTAEAREEIRRLERHYPGAVKVPLLMGWLDELTGRLPQAREAYVRAVTLAPRDDQKRDILLSVADLDRRLENLPGAASLLAETTAKYGECARSRQLRTLLLVQEGRLQDALSEAVLMAEENPGNPHASRLRRQLHDQVSGEIPPASGKGGGSDSDSR